MKTDHCQKCRSEIAAEAARCPECGYEADPGLVLKLLMVLAIPLFFFSLLLGLATLALMADGASPTDLAAGLGVAAVMFAVSASVMWVASQYDERGPTDPPVFG